MSGDKARSRVLASIAALSALVATGFAIRQWSIQPSGRPLSSVPPFEVAEGNVPLSPRRITGRPDLSWDGTTLAVPVWEIENDLSRVDLVDRSDPDANHRFPANGKFRAQCVAARPRSTSFALAGQSWPQRKTEVVVYDYRRRTMLASVEVSTFKVDHLAWSPGGGRLAIGGLRWRYGCGVQIGNDYLALWEPWAGRFRELIRDPKPSRQDRRWSTLGVAFDADGARFYHAAWLHGDHKPDTQPDRFVVTAYGSDTGEICAQRTLLHDARDYSGPLKMPYWLQLEFRGGAVCLGSVRLDPVTLERLADEKDWDPFDQCTEHFSRHFPTGLAIEARDAWDYVLIRRDRGTRFRKDR
jgi:hypothetical protein